jgi:polysaccharide chain length determinant protein (PEP-CTERM system associated)
VIPGKKYKPEDFLAIAWRYRWVIVVPLVLCSIGAFVWSERLPNRYGSESVVLIIPPQVTEKAPRANTDTLPERLNLLKQQILSRTRLERIIEEFNLYPQERKSQLMEQVVEQMRKDIGVDLPKVRRKQEPGYFVVSFESENPQTAMLVTERLASLFVKEHLETRSTKADTTSQFYQGQVDEALRKLKEQESRLEVFRRANAGRLPEQVDANLKLMESARQELQSLIDSINRDHDRQLTIERNIADETSLGPIVVKGGKEGAAEVLQTTGQELAAAKAALATLQLRLKDDHPDVRIAKSRIADLEKKAVAEALQQPVSEGQPTGPLSTAAAERLRRVSSMRAELDSLARGIELKRAKADKTQATIADYQRRVQASPTLQTQLSELMREYGTLKESYEGLVKKTQDASLSSSLEQHQVGEQFRIVDPATRPDVPRSPNRLRIELIGAVMGLGLGLAIAALLAYRDTSLRSEDDVLAALTLPVVAVVPTLWTESEMRKARHRRLVVGSFVAVTLVFSAAAVAWKLRLLSSWGL